MHRVAEEGIAAHWKYKEGRIGADRDEQYFRWLRQLLEWQQEIRDPQEFIQNLKVDLYPEEVYTFTPRGEVKSLPRGATPIDFAYSIHTDIGHQCVGARVNGRMVPLRHRLKNGDIVEIVTQQGHKPSRDWLGYVTTSRARNKIKQFLHNEEKRRSIELGRKLFEKEVKRFDVNAKAVMDEGALTTVAKGYGLQKADDLMAAIGYGKYGARQVLSKVVPQEELKERPPDGRLTSVVKRVLRQGDDRIKVRGIDDLLVVRARCCNPIRGEKIVGYITRGKGVSVHSAQCPNVLNLMYDADRRIEVEWDQGGEQAAYTVRLHLQVEDRKGILADVSAKVAGINTNITTLEATTNEREGRIEMTVEINDMKHLEKVIKSLRTVNGVLEVERSAAR
jgi:GTP pyrophosphokinase